MDSKIRLELLGITSNQVEAGVYAVVLCEAGGRRRIPIIIGASEAQSIQCRLQDIRTPRPLTHDLMVNMMRAYGLALKEVRLRQLSNGIFAADLLLTDGEREIAMDSRSSDAIALAVRVGAPIYTTPEVLENAGFEPDNTTAFQGNTDSRLRPRDAAAERATLRKRLQEAIECEDYEQAGRIKAELDRLDTEAPIP